MTTTCRRTRMCVILTPKTAVHFLLIALFISAEYNYTCAQSRTGRGKRPNFEHAEKLPSDSVVSTELKNVTIITVDLSQLAVMDNLMRHLSQDNQMEGLDQLPQRKQIESSPLAKLGNFNSQSLSQFAKSDNEILWEFITDLDRRINESNKFILQLKVGQNVSGLPKEIDEYVKRLTKFNPLFQKFKSQYSMIQPYLTNIDHYLKEIKVIANEVKFDLCGYLSCQKLFQSHNGKLIDFDRKSNLSELIQSLNHIQQYGSECKDNIFSFGQNFLSGFQRNVSKFSDHLLAFEPSLTAAENHLRLLQFHKPNLSDGTIPHLKPHLSTYFEQDQPGIPFFHSSKSKLKPSKYYDFSDFTWNLPLKVPIIPILCHIIIVILFVIVVVIRVSILFFVSLCKMFFGPSNVNSNITYLCFSVMFYNSYLMSTLSKSCTQNILLVFDFVLLISFVIFATVPGYYCNKLILFLIICIHLSISLLVWQTDTYYTIIIYFFLVVFVIVYIVITEQWTLYVATINVYFKIIMLIKQLIQNMINWTRHCCNTVTNKYFTVFVENLLLYLLPSRMRTIHEDRQIFNDTTYPTFQLLIWQYILVAMAIQLIYSNLSLIVTVIEYYLITSKNITKSPYFREAEENAKVKFLYHDIVKLEWDGLVYNMSGHGITLRFPKGIVDKWETLYIEVGVVNMHGPFTFPEDAQPISPVLWLCRLDESVVFKKKFEVVLPHYLQYLTDEDIELNQIRFSKASHTPTQRKLQYDFHPWETNFQQEHDSYYRNYGTLLTDHCCFYCLLANITPQITLNAGYCLVRLESISHVSNDIKKGEIHFVVIFCLDTCMRALEIQFPQNEGYNILSWKYFHFKDDPQGPHIKFMVPKEHKDFVIGLDPRTAKITAKDVNNWDNGLSTMIDWYDRKIYPPRVVITIMPRSNENIVFVLPVTVDGCSDEYQLDVDLTFPLGMYTHNTLESSPPVDLQLSVLLRELTPLASNWENIGVYLGIDDGTLLRIKVDEHDVLGKLREMLRAWLRRVDPTGPTWTAMIKAVWLIDEARANELTSKYCPNYSP